MVNSKRHSASLTPTYLFVMTWTNFCERYVDISSAMELTHSSAICLDTTLDSNGLLSVGFSVDGDATSLPCGIKKTGDTYTITVAVNGNSLSSYRFDCITTGTGANLNNFPTNVSVGTFKTGQIEDTVSFIGNKQGLQFSAFKAFGSKTPTLEARMGEMVNLRVVYNKDVRKGPDTWGSVFHLAFIPQSGADIFLDVYTLGLGTVVKVTGSLTGQTFTYYVPVKRDSLNRITLPSAYIPSSIASTALDPSKLAVKVEVQTPGEVVAVRARSSLSGATFGEYLVLPDDVLGTKYNCYTGSDEAGGHVSVFAIQDTTALTINFNGFDPAGLTVNGNAVTATQAITLNENDVVNIQCDMTCGLITLSSDKPIGVVTGHEDAKLTSTFLENGYFVSQLPPVKTYGKSFVFYDNTSYQIILEDPTSTVNYTRNSGTVTGVTSGTIVSDVSGSAAELFTFTSPVLILSSPDSGTVSPFTVPTPSRYQWSTSYFLLFEASDSIIAEFTALSADLGDIEIVNYFGVVTLLSSITGYSAIPSVGSSDAYASYTYGFDPLSSPTLVEFRSGSNQKPFSLRILGGTPQHRPMTIGTRYPTVNPCDQSATVVRSFGSGRENSPGDMEDNDCNGMVDDQANDGTNNALDLAPGPVNPHIGIYVDTLVISNNANFPTDGTALTYTLMTNGCNTTLANGLTIQPFMWNQDIGAQYSSYHVMETKPFRAFYLGTPTVYYRVTVGFCFGNLTGSRCDNSCQQATGRKRRDADEIVQLDTQLRVTDVDTNEQTVTDEPCSMNRLYWIPAIILLVTIFVEAVMNGVCLYLRFSMKPLA